MGKNTLNDKRIIVTGVGYKPLETKFYHKISGNPTHEPILVEGKECKLNIGAAVSLALAGEGATVHMLARTEEKLRNIQEHIHKTVKCPKDNVAYSVVDLLDEKSIQEFIEKLPKDKTIYLVHSVGLGAGSYKLKDDNPYLLFDEVPDDSPTKEFNIVVKSLLMLVKALYPVFKRQKETRIVGISSMSAIRTYPGGYSHSAAKAGIHNALRTLALELDKYNIFVTEIMPGIIDTGLYDKPAVIEAVKRVQKEHNREIKGKEIPLAPPSSVADLVITALKSDGFCLDLRLIAHKQWPWDGS